MFFHTKNMFLAYAFGSAVAIRMNEQQYIEANELKTIPGDVLLAKLKALRAAMHDGHGAAGVYKTSNWWDNAYNLVGVDREYEQVEADERQADSKAGGACWEKNVVLRVAKERGLVDEDDRVILKEVPIEKIDLSDVTQRHQRSVLSTTKAGFHLENVEFAVKYGWKKILGKNASADKKILDGEEIAKMTGESGEQFLQDLLTDMGRMCHPFLQIDDLLDGDLSLTVQTGEGQPILVRFNEHTTVAQLKYALQAPQLKFGGEALEVDEASLKKCGVEDGATISATLGVYMQNDQLRGLRQAAKSQLRIPIAFEKAFRRYEYFKPEAIQIVEDQTKQTFQYIHRLIFKYIKENPSDLRSGFSVLKKMYPNLTGQSAQNWENLITQLERQDPVTHKIVSDIITRGEEPESINDFPPFLLYAIWHERKQLAQSVGAQFNDIAQILKSIDPNSFFAPTIHEILKTHGGQCVTPEDMQNYIVTNDFWTLTTLVDHAQKDESDEWWFLNLEAAITKTKEEGQFDEVKPATKKLLNKITE